MGFLNWLYDSGLADAVRSTTWVYPWVNASHSIGMGFLVGTIFMISLRVLGFGQFSIAPLRKFVAVIWAAFAVNLLSGSALFSADAVRFFESPTFRVKALFIVLGGIATWLLIKNVFRDGGSWSESGQAPANVKIIAAVTIACWVTAIFAGRLTAYLP